MYKKLLTLMILGMIGTMHADTKLQKREKRVEAVREQREERKEQKRAERIKNGRRFVRTHGKPSYDTPTAGETRMGVYHYGSQPYTQPTLW